VPEPLRRRCHSAVGASRADGLASLPVTPQVARKCRACCRYLSRILFLLPAGPTSGANAARCRCSTSLTMAKSDRGRIRCRMRRSVGVGEDLHLYPALTSWPGTPNSKRSDQSATHIRRATFTYRGRTSHTRLAHKVFDSTLRPGLHSKKKSESWLVGPLWSARERWSPVSCHLGLSSWFAQGSATAQSRPAGRDGGEQRPEPLASYFNHLCNFIIRKACRKKLLEVELDAPPHRWIPSHLGSKLRPPAALEGVRPPGAARRRELLHFARSLSRNFLHDTDFLRVSALIRAFSSRKKHLLVREEWYAPPSSFRV